MRFDCTIYFLHQLSFFQLVLRFFYNDDYLSSHGRIYKINISLILKIDNHNNLTNIYTKEYRNMAAIYRRRRHADLNSQASTQGCNT